MDLPRIFDEHHEGLFRFAYRLTGSAHDAEDIVQECFLTLLRPDCRFDPDRRPVRAYLFGAVRNQALKRRPKPDAGIPPQQTTASPEDQTLRTEIEATVADAVLRLPENQREVLILAHYERLPLSEIAAALEIEVGAVKSRLQRARAHLREQLTAFALNRR
ncbi:MAG TPA: RNA polymerase sigma factor [Bryobacteraceae bacterium]|jgi:RNA polymerase sigma-70 factor (ECF subfamily)